EISGYVPYLCCFFFQAEDGIRDRNVTGVQTCALPIFFFSSFKSLVKSLELSACPTVLDTCINCLIVSLICLSSCTLSVTIKIESKTFFSFFFKDTNWWAVQAIELDLPLPALC